MTKDTINATVCLNKGRMQYHGGCDDQMNIQVKNCTGYYVYYIQPPEVCNAAYCFGMYLHIKEWRNIISLIYKNSVSHRLNKS